MKKHTKIYMDFFGYSIADFIPCEVCGAKAVDINHIECRGMGGSKMKDHIDNLMAMCRPCHVKLGDKTEYKEMLIQTHQRKVNQCACECKDEWMVDVRINVVKCKKCGQEW